MNIPKEISVKRNIPKEKIYEHASDNVKLRQLFVQQVDKIIWLAKIAASTMNITDNKEYVEIDIFEIKQKTAVLDNKVLETIANIIPRPILFVLTFNQEERYAIIHKKQLYISPQITQINTDLISENQRNQRTKEKTISDNLQIKITGNSVQAIYENFLRQIDPDFDRVFADNLEQAAADTEEIRKIKKQIETINRRIAKEKQDNLRFELAEKRRKLEVQLKLKIKN
jgi:hypothetical protein